MNKLRLHRENVASAQFYKAVMKKILFMYIIITSSLVNCGRGDIRVSSLEIYQHEQEQYIHRIDTFIFSSQIEELIMIYKQHKIQSLLNLIAERLVCFRDDPAFYAQRANELGFEVVESPSTEQAYFQRLFELLYEDDKNTIADTGLSVSLGGLPSPTNRLTTGRRVNDNQLNELNFEIPMPSYCGSYHEDEIVFDDFEDECEIYWSDSVPLPNQIPESPGFEESAWLQSPPIRRRPALAYIPEAAEMPVLPEVTQAEAPDIHNKSDVAVFGIEQEHIQEQPVEVSTKSKFRCCSLQ